MKKTIILNIVFCFLAQLSFAQPGNDLPGVSDEVIINFEAKLNEVEKISIQPALPPVSEIDKNLTYDVPDKKIDLEYLPPKLRPIKVKKEEAVKGYNGHIKLGYGFPNSPYGELGYQYVNPEKFKVGGYLFHHSANNKKHEHQRFATTAGELNGAYFLNRDIGIEANMGFLSEQLHFYGFNDESTSVPRDQVRQHFNTFKFGSRVYNIIKNRQDISYEGGFNFYALNDNYATTENGFDLKIAGTKWIAEKHPINVGLRTDFSVFDDGRKQDLNNFFLTPSFTFHGKIFSAKAGLNLASHKDKFYFLPDVEVNVNIIGNTLAAFAGAGGDLYKNNLRNLSDYNPFISTFKSLEVRSTKYRNYYGGLKGSFKNVNYSGQLDYRQTGDLALFVVNPDDSLRFSTVYDSVEIFTIKGSVAADLSNDLNIIFTIAQNIYSVESQENTEAWGLPTFEGNLGIRYSMLDKKLLLKADAFVESGILVQDENTLQAKLDGLFDVSLGAEYYIIKNVGAFLQVNNIAGNKRQRWYRYRSYGINILGGVMARF